jgi:hypothetical protein
MLINLFFILKTVVAITQEFPITARTHIDGFSKDVGNFLKKSAKRCQHSDFRSPFACFFNDFQKLFCDSTIAL